MALVEGELSPLRKAVGRNSAGGHDLDSSGAPEWPLSRSRRGRAQRWPERLLGSVWGKVVLRTLGICAGMLALAAVGALATFQVPRGHAVSLPGGGSSAGSSPVLPDVPAAKPTPLSAGRALQGSAQHVSSGRGAAPSALHAQAPAPSAAVTADGKLILNLATAVDLQRLPGIGRKRAEAILALRQKLGGRFRRLADLMRIRGIGTRRFQQLVPLLVLDPPKPAPSSEPAPSSAAAVSAPHQTGG